MLARLRKFDYIKPRSVEEALALMVEHQGKASFKAGGTDLLVQMKNQKTAPGLVIDLMGLDQLKGITADEKTVTIGALTTVNEVAESAVLRQSGLGVLSDAAGQLGSYQVRNRATIGGNLCNASPSAETAPALLVLGAEAVIGGKDGKRVEPLERFFKGPGRTVLQQGEVLLSLRVPKPAEGARAGYIKHCYRRAMDLAVVGVAVQLSLGKDGQCTAAKIALGAVAPTPIRVPAAEALLVGRIITADLCRQAAQVAAGEAAPVTDVRGSKEYRIKMVEVQARRLLAKLANC